MLNDKIVRGAIVGLLADIIKLLVNFICFKFQLSHNIFWQLVAARFVDRVYLDSSFSYIIGATADLTVSASIGVLFLYSVKLMGNHYLWIKGIGFGLIIWVALFGTLLGQSISDKIPQDPIAILVTLIAHVFFGFSLAFFTLILTKKKSR